MATGPSEAGIQWSKRLFDTLTEGGMWGVPRSGLTFQKKGGKLILVNRVPYTPDMSEAFSRGAPMPPSPTDLAQHQQRDFEAIAASFRAAGIEVEDTTTTQKGK